MIPAIVVIVCLLGYSYFTLFQTERMIKLELDLSNQFREPFKSIFFWQQRFPKYMVARYRIGGVLALLAAALLIAVLVYRGMNHGSIGSTGAGTLDMN